MKNIFDYITFIGVMALFLMADQERISYLITPVIVIGVNEIIRKVITKLKNN